MSQTSMTLEKEIITRTEVAAYTLKNVSFGYSPSQQVISDVSFSVREGERVALLGANGSGKSSLLKILNGLIFPTSGSIQCFGEELTETGLKMDKTNFQFRRRVGFVFQNSDAQLFNTTVREEIIYGPLQLHLSAGDIEQRLNDIVGMLGITHLLDRSPFRLSGGEKKKVAIASVLITNPNVVLLDEPTNGLDPRSQMWMTDILNTLNTAGKTIIIATHDLDMVRRIADRVIVMGEDHKVAAIGQTDQILQNRELLIAVNLIHEHSHWHGEVYHSH